MQMPFPQTPSEIDIELSFQGRGSEWMFVDCPAMMQQNANSHVLIHPPVWTTGQLVYGKKTVCAVVLPCEVAHLSSQNFITVKEDQTLEILDH